MKRRLARVAGAVATALLMTLSLVGCVSLGIGLGALEANLVDLEPLESTAFEQRFRVLLRLRNPNDRPVEIDGLRFDLELNGERLATGLSDQTLTLPRLGDAVIEVTTTTTLLDLLRQALALNERGRDPVPALDYALYGRVYLAGSLGSLHFESSGRFEPSPR